MKKFFVIAAMAITCLSANAQQQAKGTFSIIPKVGLGYAHIGNYYAHRNSVVNVNEGGGTVVQQGGGFATTGVSNYGPNIIAGYELRYQATDLFGVSFGMNYAYEESTKKFTVPSSNIELEPKLNYLTIPVLAHFNIGNHFGVKVGVQPNIAISASDGYSDNAKDNLKGVTLSIPVGVAYQFNSPFMLELTYDIPVTKMNKEGETMMNNAFWLTCGWRIDL